MDPDESLDAVDLMVLQAVGELYEQVDPVPEGLAERMRFGINVALLEAEIAEITREAAVAVRGVEPTDTVTFTSPSISVMVSVTVQGASARIDGWVTAGGAEVEAVGVGWARTTTADATGRFVLDHAPRGPMHFIVRRPGHRTVVTRTVDL